MAGVRRQRRGHERGRRRDEAVEDDGHVMSGAGQDHPGEAPDLEPADARQHLDAVRCVGPVDGESTTDDIDLASPAAIVDPGAAAGRRGRVGASHQRGGRAGRRRVADPHLTGHEQVGPLGDRRFGQRRASLDGHDRLLRAHRRSARDVVGATRERAVDQAGRSRQRTGDTEVSNDDARAGLPRQHVDGGASSQKVLDHLRRDDLGVRAHALGDDAVVRREHEDDRTLDARRAPADHGEPHRDLLEAAEAPRRLRQMIEMTPRRRAGVRHRRRNGVTELAEQRRIARRPWPPAL